MRRVVSRTFVAALGLVVAVSSGAQTTAELRQAEHDVPLLLDLLQVRPGMTLADVGAGAGAMTLVAARRLGPSSRLYATDVNPRTVAHLRELVQREHLANVQVVEGTSMATELPTACCDAIFLRDVYHHFEHPDEMNRSLAAAIKPGGRLAVIDFEPRPGWTLPPGVPTNRGGHGIRPSIVVEEMTRTGLVHDRTMADWPPGDGGSFLVLFTKPR